MAKWKTLENQILAGTLVDSQGERNTKEFLLSLCAALSTKTRFPLGQKHDMSLEPVGYIDNFRVVPANKEGKEWNLVGDVYFHDVEIDDALKGFSYSICQDIQGDRSERQISVYVPFPYYNDESLLTDLTSPGSGIVAGAWRKKAAETDTVSLIVSSVLFLAAPAYTNFWNEKVSPLIAKLQSRLKGNHSIQYVQTSQGHLGETFGIYFIPQYGKEDECLTLSLITDGIQAADQHVARDDLAVQKGVHLVKMIFSGSENTYVIKSIEYQDGSVVNH